MCHFIDETQYDRHHKFIEDPEKDYKETHFLKYCFGTKYITPEVRLSHLKIDIGLMMTN